MSNYPEIDAKVARAKADLDEVYAAGVAVGAGAAPTVTVSKSGKVTIITATDKNGTTTAQVMDGDDYVLTEGDKAEIADEVGENHKGTIAQLVIEELQGLPVFGVVDENKRITTTTLLPDGTYTLAYDNADGTTTELTTFVIGGGGDEPTYINLIPTAKTPTNTNEVFNGGKGYMDGKYASSSSPYYGDDSATFVTGLIESAPNSVFYIKGVTIDTSNNHNRLSAFGSSGGCDAAKPFTQMTDYATLEALGEQYYKLTMNTAYITANFSNFKYIMFSAMGSGANLIVSTTPIE